jgi:hypothetical protein|tara:strand:+ start:2665 stop:3339 length:675 start_codon:yes stop_codon:yes gene_type:complete
MTTLLRKDLNNLSIVDLMDIESAIALSDDLISDDPSVELMAKEQLMAVIGKRHKKIDGIEWARQEAQRNLETVLSWEEETKKTKKRLKSKLDGLKNLLKFLANYSGSKEIKGSVWHWTLSDQAKPKIEVNTDKMETWDDETKEKFLIIKVVEVIENTQIKTPSGKVLEDTTYSKPIKVTNEPNIEALLKASNNSEQLPDGVKVYHDYRVNKPKLVAPPKKSLAV